MLLPLERVGRTSARDYCSSWISWRFVRAILPMPYTVWVKKQGHTTFAYSFNKHWPNF